ncbi:MAG TPA: sigma-70 family RNA polymerase sigma factor [Pseudonocardiaceae bacterium]|nr:sigma-70 family RNA polymerase sigma factor [Pseudonocardiaceae bacterium]
MRGTEFPGAALPAPRSPIPPPAAGSNTGAGGTSRRGGHPPSPGRGDPGVLEVAELLRGAGQGEAGAWEEILRRYSGAVVGRVHSFRLQDADALDAVQMTWLRLAENIHRIRHPEGLGGWLMTTASRECLRILRQAKRAPIPADTVMAAVADPAVDPEQRVIDAETARTLRELLAELPAGRRRLLRALFTEHPQSYAELATSIGIPLGSIGPTRARALRQLRQMLDEHHPSLANALPPEAERAL